MRANPDLLVHSHLYELMTVNARNIDHVHVRTELAYNDTLVVHYIVFITYKVNN